MASDVPLASLPLLFSSGGVPLVGTLFRRDLASTAREPAIVVSGSWLNVKEQMATTYARALAARGFTTFVFDFAGWGESGGPLRHVEMPTAKARDIAAAVDLVGSLAYVRAERVGYLGVCASAQYALRACATGARIASFVSVAGWFHDAETVAPFYGGAAGVGERLAWAADAMDAHRRDGSLRTVPAYAPGEPRAGMSFELDYYGNPARGAVPAWTNAMAEVSWLHWLTLDGLSPASAVRTPTLIVHADGCALPDNAKAVHARLAGPKHLAWLDGGQTDFYDLPDHLGRAVDLAAAHFAETLR